MSPSLLFGAANVGSSYKSQAAVQDLLAQLQSPETGIHRIDTAARYPPTAPGDSERLLGAADAGKAFTIDTKILVPAAGRTSFDGSLTRANIAASIEQSLASLGVRSVNVLYCHGPDHETPIAEQAAALDEQFRLGRFKQLGISNFSIPMIDAWMAEAATHNYVRPTVYQGQYNLVCRGGEAELFPTLRKHGIAFNAFSPLAGGFLTGKFVPDAPASALAGTRWEQHSASKPNPFGAAARNWYDKPSMHAALVKIQAACAAYQGEGIDLVEAALRWIVYHSALGDEDGLLLGASRAEQLVGNVAQIKNGPLAQDLVDVLDGVWESVREDAPAVMQ